MIIKIQKIEIGDTALQTVVALFTAYQQELNADLCFQNFEKELENPLIKYGKPNGSLLVAKVSRKIVGCVALQDLGNDVCEMKRLYVQPNYRKYKIGEQLTIAIIEEAKALGYTKMKLDTLQKLQPAIQLYNKLGFTNTTAYYQNPLDEVVYMELEL